MENFDASELWRIIPPEEKFDLMSRAHTKGILAMICIVIVSGTCAVGLQVPTVFWCGIAVSPLVFQYIAGKAWRDLRPKIMLEYLAVRTVARRFAFVLNARELQPRLVFRAACEEEFESDEMQAALQAAFDERQFQDVWVVLFTDCLVLLAEDHGGARLVFGCHLSDSLDIVGTSPTGEGDYSSHRRVELIHGDRKAQRKLALTSRQPAALVVFEKQLKGFRDAAKTVASQTALDDFSKLFGDQGGEDADMPGSLGLGGAR